MQNYLKVVFDWQSPIITGVILAIIPLGAVVGFIITGLNIGTTSRRHGIMIADVIAIISVGILVSNTYLIVFIIMRFFIGLSVGIGASYVLVYLKETVPVQIFGLLSALGGAFLAVGIVGSDLWGVAIINLDADDFAEMDTTWRIVFGLPIMFPMIRLLMLTFYYKKDPAIFYLRKNLK